MSRGDERSLQGESAVHEALTKNRAPWKIPWSPTGSLGHRYLTYARSRGELSMRFFLLSLALARSINVGIRTGFLN